ncbi:MAG: glycosyltransferase family 4 protein [Lachnospiraceae bacterium]|nr:glycosyltransferase family 4 protein [Lachnospiraceae bacterium]
MRVLWVCNQCIPVIAEHLNINVPNKEGWLAGLSEKIIAENDKNLELGICFNGGSGFASYKGEYEVTAYGYDDNTAVPEEYNEALESRFKTILEDFKPDVIHIFGTEYPHTLAVCKAADDTSKILIGIQGLCSVYAKHYFDGLPEEIIEKETLRDRLKSDNLKEQKEKFVKRGENEIEAIKLAQNVTGRTDWDKKYTSEYNPKAEYYFMNETLRSNFYDGKWEYEKCEKHTLFASQGDYPIKGLHVLLRALTEIKKEYPDVKLYVAGNIITGEDSLKKKILIGTYGKYVRKLIKDGGLEENVFFTGPLNADKMKERYLKSNAFISPSMMENSPNSLGEAMLLSMPAISSDVGGVRNLMSDDEGFIYPSLDEKALIESVKKCFSMNGSDQQKEMCDKASKKARITHDPDANYKRLLEIYDEIAAKKI